MPLNILHITPNFDYNCGRSYYVFQLMKGLKRSGVNPFLLTNGGDSLERLERHDLHYTVNRDINKKNPVALKKSISAIKNAVKEHNINLIHCHHRYPEFLVSSYKKLISPEVKSVMTVLSFTDSRYFVEFRSDRIICVSKGLLKMLMERYKVDKKKVILIPNFVDETEPEESGKEYTKKENDFIILTVGRYHPEKNQKIIIEALGKINNPEIKLLLAGAGSERENLLNLCREKKINFEFIEPQQDIYRYIKAADACVMSPLRDPFPNFMLQSGLTKKIFIGSDVEGINELIESGKNGLLFDSGDSSQLADLIMKVKSNIKEYSKLSDKLYNGVMNNYTSEAVVPRIIKLYSEL